MRAQTAFEEMAHIGTKRKKLLCPWTRKRCVSYRKNSISNALRQAHARFGAIDVLVNNAGHGYRSALEEGEPYNVAELFQTNVIVDVLHQENLPMRLLLGSDAVTFVRRELKQRLDELDAWEQFSVASDFS